MRSSTVAALAILATAAPTFAVPVATTLTGTNTTSTNSATTTAASTLPNLTAEQSAALSLGTIGTIVSLGGSVIGGIIDHFKNSGNQQQRRGALELEQLLARATDESQAGALSFTLGDASAIASIASSASSIFENLFGNKQSREYLEFVSRQTGDGTGDLGFGELSPGLSSIFKQMFDGQQQRRNLAALLARDVTPESSEAISLGTLGTIVSLGGSVISGIIDHFKNNGSQQQRRGALELEQLLARAADDSGALSFTLGDASAIASIASSASSIFENLFGSKQSREIIDLLARDATDGSEAISLSSLAGIASIGGGIADVLHSIFSSGSSQQQRELAQLLARTAADDSEAISLSSIAGIASIGGGIADVLHSIFSSGSSQQQREVAELLARQDESGALSLSDIESFLSKIFGRADSDMLARQDQSGAIDISTIVNALGGILSSFLRREDLDMFARQDQSGAIDISTIVNALGGILSSFLRREDLEMLARQDQSGAVSLGTIGTIVGLAAPLVSGIIDEFKNSGSQSQRRDAEILEALLARAPVAEPLLNLTPEQLQALKIAINQKTVARDNATVDESGAISFSALKDIGSIAGSAFNIISNLFSGSSNSQQQSRELLELLARTAKKTRSLNDLD